MWNCKILIYHSQPLYPNFSSHIKYIFNSLRYNLWFITVCWPNRETFIALRLLSSLSFQTFIFVFWFIMTAPEDIRYRIYLLDYLILSFNPTSTTIWKSASTWEGGVWASKRIVSGMWMHYKCIMGNKYFKYSSPNISSFQVVKVEEERRQLNSNQHGGQRSSIVKESQFQEPNIW